MQRVGFVNGAGRMRAWRLVGTVAVAGLLAAACAGPQVPPLAQRPPEPSVELDPAAPCAPGTATTGTADSAEPEGVEVTYDAARATIVLSGGSGVTLSALAEGLGRRAADLLEETAQGEWLLKTDLEILAGASLRIAAPEVSWLKLRSDPGEEYVKLVAEGGELTVEGSCITSWDTRAQAADTDDADGRAYLLARSGAPMVLNNVQLLAMGYGSPEAYGLSWREGATGSITGSVVSHMYFGLYTYKVKGLQVLDNVFRNNLVYGIDPHTSSSGLRIERNLVHHNEKHGIILAEDCTDSFILDNISHSNGHHGIVLYQRSNGNLIEGNTVYLNAVQGIDINESNDSIVRANKVYANLTSGIAVGQGSKNIDVLNNEVRLNEQDGIRVVSDAAEVTVQGNSTGENNRYGLYFDTPGSVQALENTIFGHNRSGIRLEIPVVLGPNTLFDNEDGDVSPKPE